MTYFVAPERAWQGGNPCSAERICVAEAASDPVKQLAEKQLESWKRDDSVAGAIILLLDPKVPDDVELQSMGHPPTLDQPELASVLSRADQETASGWVLSSQGQSGRVYPLKGSGVLQGLWIVFSGSEVPPPDDWQHDAARFGQELMSLRGSRSAPPPSLRQLVDAIPAMASNQPEQMSPLHWEKSQARVEVPLQDELENCLINDQMPIF